MSDHTVRRPRDYAQELTEAVDVGFQAAAELTRLRSQLAVAREALEKIQAEATRENGRDVHLRRVVALQCKTALAAMYAKP